MARVVIVGVTGVASLERSYERAFRALGHEVLFWEPEAAMRRVARGGTLGATFARFVHVEPWVRKANLELLRMVDELRPEIVLVIGTGLVRGGTLAQIRARAPRTVLYRVYPDSPHNLDADTIHTLPFFDRVAASSPPWADAFARLGAPRAEYLPFAADESLHQPANGVVPVYDVGFIGSWRPEREALLEQLASFRLRLWGSDYWKRRVRPGSPLRACWAGGPAVGEEFARACAGTRVMLNIMDPATWPGPNMRVFEHAACGAFSLVTRSSAVTDLFAEGEQIECFDSADEAREKVRRYLADDAARRRIAAAAHALVGAGHTYVDRARTLMEWYSLDSAARVD